jgi:hypothetical protein
VPPAFEIGKVFRIMGVAEKRVSRIQCSRFTLAKWRYINGSEVDWKFRKGFYLI